MDDQTFWAIIERSSADSNGTVAEQAIVLERLLSGMDPEDVAGFDEWFVEHNQELYCSLTPHGARRPNSLAYHLMANAQG